MANYNDSLRLNNPMWSASTKAVQITIAGGGAPTTIDLSDPAAVASGGMGGAANTLQSGYVMICNQGAANLTIQNKNDVAGFANHGILLTPGATFEFAVGEMSLPLGTASNSILVKGAAGDVFTVIYF
jgi:hypothetical protein|tara:strand:+ start:4317 stop:4700 length:384 start_codon:yes stop_codon:yes gene_type:complete